MLVWEDPGDPGKEDAKKDVLVCRVIGSKDRGSRWAMLSGVTTVYRAAQQCIMISNALLLIVLTVQE